MIMKATLLLQKAPEGIYLAKCQLFEFTQDKIDLCPVNTVALTVQGQAGLQHYNQH